jgi:ankyrin repeat protein
LQIDQLLSLERLRDIKDRLGKLPIGLRNAYDEIYTAIQNQEGSLPEIANRTFQWVMCSCIPLSPSTLIAAVCQDPEDDEPRPVDIDIDIVLDACHNLLSLDSELNVCRFAHLSVQEYFEQHRWSTSQANGLVGKVCLLFLNHPNYWIDQERLNRYIKYERCIDELCTHKNCYSDDENIGRKSGCGGELAPVLEYTDGFWPIHVQLHCESNIDGCLSRLLQKFLGSMNKSGPAYRSWYWSYLGSREHTGDDTLLNSHYENLLPHTSVLFPICFFGFYNVLLDWWNTPLPDIEVRNKKGESLLVLAALGNSLFILEKLLDAGADVNAQVGGDYGSALVAAVESKNKTSVELLLNAGADVNAQVGGVYGSALVAAASSNNKAIVELLLDAGADANTPVSHIYSNALVAAVRSNNKAITQLLLDAGADINAQAGGAFSKGSALATAVVEDKEMVKLLLDTGANVNMQVSGTDGSALVAAARGGDKTIVKLLLDARADVNAQVSASYYGSALVAAASSNNKAIVELLLDAGADVNMQVGGNYGSALAAAASSNNTAIVELVLDAGADVTMQVGGNYSRALAVAARSGDKTIIKLLLDAGADVNAHVGGKYGIALEAAKHLIWDREAMQLLLDSGAM